MKSFQVSQNFFCSLIISLAFFLGEAKSPKKVLSKSSQGQKTRRSSQGQKNISLYTFGGLNIDVPVGLEECATNLTTKLPDYINTHGHCVTLYKDKNCTGDFVIIQKSDEAQYMDSTFFSWKSPNGTGIKTRPGYIRSNQIKVESIGPCFSKCDPRNIEQLTQEPVIATFLDVNYHHGANVSIAVKGCTPFPTSFKRRVSSHVFELGQHHTCFEYHKQSDCMGEYYQTRLRHLNPYSDHATLIYAVNYDESYDRGGNDAVAVSLCGFQCKTQDKLLPTTTTSPETILEPDHVRIYDEKNFSGFSKDVNMSGSCVDLNDEWEGQLISIKTNGICTILYDKFGCNSTSAKTLTINSNEDYFCFSKLSKNIQDSPSEIKSLSKCPKSSSKLYKKESREMFDELQQSPDSNGTSFFSFIFIMFSILIVVALLSLGVAHLVFYATNGANKSCTCNQRSSLSISNTNLL